MIEKKWNLNNWFWVVRDVHAEWSAWVFTKACLESGMTYAEMTCWLYAGGTR